MTSNSQLSSVKNSALFKFESSKDGAIHDWMKMFFEKNEFPWQCLGKSLTKLLQEKIAAVPQDERLQGKVSSGAFLFCEEGVVVEEGAIVEAGAYICGPTYISKGATVRHGAYIRGSCYVASGAIVGHTTEIKGSILMCDAKAAHFAYVGDSILGFHCNLGAGTKLANLRLDAGEVRLTLDGAKVGSGLKKFGAILGDRAQTGCNSVMNPGTILWPKALVMPNSTATGLVERKA